MGPKKKNTISVSVDKPTSVDPWLGGHDDAELLLDVFADDTNIYIVSTLAGVEPSDLDISVNNDLLTIRGTRKHQHETAGRDYFYQECYWGGFSRSIILPMEIKTDGISAELKNGVLKITLPKMQRSRSIPISIT